MQFDPMNDAVITEGMEAGKKNGSLALSRTLDFTFLGVTFS